MEPTYDFYLCLPQLFAAHGCFPQLPATPLNIAAHQQPLVLCGAAGRCVENAGAAQISNYGAMCKTAGVNRKKRKAKENVKQETERERQTEREEGGGGNSLVPHAQQPVSIGKSWCAESNR